MYIVGNSETASSIPMWSTVLDSLERAGNIGETLALCCPRHPDTPIEVKTADDFVLQAPEGGCDQKCQWRLKCGHKCPNKCHSNALHDVIRCLEQCRRLKKSCEHPCQLPCGDPCEPYCTAIIPDIVLKCGHLSTSLRCHQAQNPDQIFCSFGVEVSVPHCGHTAKFPCGSLPLNDENYSCPAKCEANLPCGHICSRLAPLVEYERTGSLFE